MVRIYNYIYLNQKKNTITFINFILHNFNQLCTVSIDGELLLRASIEYYLDYVQL